MKTTRSFLGFLCALIAAMSAGCGANGDDARDDADVDPTVGEQDGAILGGSPADAYPEAVLIDVVRDGEVKSACSGTLIAPRFVLTAARCLRGEASFHVWAPAIQRGAMADAAGTYDAFDGGDLVDPRSRDVGLLHLAAPLVLWSYPALADAPLADGARVVDVGRVQDGEISFTSLFASEPREVRSAEDIGFPYAYRTIEDLEAGDSGGPELVGEGPHVIAAVRSGSDDGADLLARVDLSRTWIVAWMKAHEVLVGNKVSGSGPAACRHDVCTEGNHLDSGCEDPCASAVCDLDPFCCTQAWDAQCIVEATVYCQRCAP